MDVVRKRMEEHLTEVAPSDYVFLVLQGAQNYGLETHMSDIDTKMILTPSFSDLVHNRKPVSTTKVLENNEHCDLKDIRLYLECLKKQNINFVETLFAKHIVNEEYSRAIYPLFDNADLVARYNPVAAVSCIKGMAYEKQNALCHPYPSKLDVLAQFGYDPKQLHHILRLREFLDNYIKGEDYEVCLTSYEDVEYLKAVKTGEKSFTQKEAIAYAAMVVAEIAEVADDFRANYDLNSLVHKVIQSNVDQLFEQVVEEVMTVSLLKDL